MWSPTSWWDTGTQGGQDVWGGITRFKNITLHWLLLQLSKLHSLCFVSMDNYRCFIERELFVCDGIPSQQIITLHFTLFAPDSQGTNNVRLTYMISISMNVVKLIFKLILMIRFSISGSNIQ